MLFLILTIIFIVISLYLTGKALLAFIFRPIENTPINASSDEPQKMIIKEAQINVDNIIEYEGEGIKSFEFRPQTWEQFIGQEDAKERAKTILRKARKKMKCHFLVDGIKGHGKTTFIELVAKSLNAHIIERIGKQIDEENIVDIINEINQSAEEYVMLFVDEIDTMDWKVVKILNPIIESFKINNKKIKPFIFTGATISKHILIKNNPDTLDRIPTHIKFTRYNEKEIAKILTQYKQQMYSGELVTKKVVEIISKNCKFNPRTSIALLEEYIVEKNMDKVLKNCRIIYEGLTKTDIKILKILEKATRPMGANAVALRAGLSQSEYIREFEPYLYEFGYINRTPSRVLSDKGKQILEEINEVK